MSYPRHLHRQRPPLAHREPPRPGITLNPGVRLHSAVLDALTELETHADPGHVHDSLRGALAYTAAIGETCLVASAADAVRAATHFLGSGLVSDAVTALTDAEAYLTNLAFPLPPEVPQPPGVATLPA